MAPRASKNASQPKSPDSRSTKRRRLQQPQTARLDRSNQMPTSEAPPSLTYAETVAALAKEPISTLAQRYKVWRENGSSHDNYCRVCHRPGRLEHCNTCKLSFHAACMPNGWIRDSNYHWFCPICVENRWHISPPTCTPPSSPEQTPAWVHTSIEPRVTAQADSSGRAQIPSPSHVVQSISREVSQERAPLPAEQLRGQGSSLHASELLSHPPQTQRNSKAPCQDVPGEDRMMVLSAPNNETSHEPPALSSAPRRHRKSRFSTLGEDVDASLAVLYRQLESIPILKKQIQELQMKNAEYLQMVKIRDQNMISLRSQIDIQYLSSQEIEKLRKSSAELEKANAELKDLREKYAALESELQVSREQATNATEMMNEWKGKLAQLLNP